MNPILALADGLEQHAAEVADPGEAAGLIYAAERIREVTAAGTYPDEPAGSAS